jgi:hypothetical protein
MISYCIAAYRPAYSRMLINDLIRKTSVPFEILIWLNCDDPEFELSLRETASRAPLHVMGRTPENIGMRAYASLFRRARYDLIVQIDDDVVAVSRNIAEQADEIFRTFPRVRQLVADVWQDDYTTGARPPMSAYRPFQLQYGLYDGPIDGWFSVFHRSVLPNVLDLQDEYLPLGGLMKQRLAARGMLGLLCTCFKVFHVIGPEYASYFNMLEFEIQKYRRLGRREIVDWYEGAKKRLPPAEELHTRVEAIFKHLAS